MAKLKAKTIDVDKAHLLVDGRVPGFVSHQVSEARRYYLNLAPPDDDNIVVVCGGCERVRHDYCISRVSFPYYCVEFVAEGEGLLVLNNKEHALTPDTIFTYGPQVSHTIQSTTGNVMTKYYVTFAGRAGLAALTECGLVPGKYVKTSAPRQIRELFDLLQKNGLAQTGHTHKVCAALIPALLHKIAETSVSAASMDSRSLATFEQLRSLLSDDFLNVHSLEEAATRCHISVAYACRLFKRFDRQSPYQFLMQRKMRYAADLLSDPNALTKQVAKRLGFAGHSQFSRAFRRVFGIYPAQFQKQQSNHSEE
jgi:AraC-like DNA-binding protein